MRRFAMMLFLTTVGLVPLTIATAQESDPIKKELNQARVDQDRKLEAAKAKLGKAIEAKLEETAAKSDLPGLKRLEAIKAAYERDQELPADAMIAKARVAYDNEVQATKGAMRKALEKAKASYTKARKIAEAEAIETELRDTAPKVAAKKVKQAPPSDPISGQWQIAIIDKRFDGDRVRNLNARFDAGGGADRPGMFWRKSGEGNYTIVFPGGGTGKVRLGPKGEQFDGRMTDGKRIHGSRKI